MAAPNFRPSGSCAQFSCILYGLGAALGSELCAQSRSPAIPDSAPAAAAIITDARNPWFMVVLPCSVGVLFVASVRPESQPRVRGDRLGEVEASEFGARLVRQRHDGEGSHGLPLPITKPATTPSDRGRGAQVQYELRVETDWPFAV